MSVDPRAFVVGWPIAHSRSPLIHGYWLGRYAIPGRYEKIAAAPEDFGALIERLRVGDYRGGNVTIPHKEAAALLCDRLTPAAARLGAVNTLWMEAGELWGDTTDGEGFLVALDREAPGWDQGGKRALVLGAGGAARAIVDALNSRGAVITVANRSFARARALTSRIGGTPLPMEDIEAASTAIDLLVNTTAAGMEGQPALDLGLSALPSHAVVDDIVYVPKETELLRSAKARALRTVGGLGMLLHQAAPGFERWFGIRPEVTPELRALVEADIAGRR